MNPRACPIEPMSAALRSSHALRLLRPLIWALLLLAAISQPQPARADVTRGTEEAEKKRKKQEIPEVPEARDLNAAFIAGVPVDVELVGAVGSLKPVDFIIRRVPVHGSLGPIRPHPRDNHKALVTYTHHGGDLPLEDTFAYACRLEGGPISAPATVALAGRKFDPKLEVTTQAKFPRAFLGQPYSSIVTVKNAGVAAFAGPIQWPAPWSGPTRLDIAPGKSVDFAVYFNPQRIGEYRDQVELQAGQRTSVVHLYADCVQALTLSPGTVELKYNPETGERTGTLTVSNGRFQKIQANLDLPGGLEGISSVELPSQSRMDILLKLPASQATAYDQLITVSAGDAVQKARIIAQPKPGEVSLIGVKSSGLDLGNVPQYSQRQVALRFRNSGGQHLVVSPQVIFPFTVSNAGEAIRLEPGQEHELKLLLTTDQVGHFHTHLNLAGSANPLTVPLAVVITEAQKPNAPRGPTVIVAPAAPIPSTVPRKLNPGELPPAISAINAARLSVLSSQGIPTPEQVINPFLDSISQVEVIERTTTSITLAWDKPTVTPHAWRVERGLSVKAPQGRLGTVKMWSPYRKYSIIQGDPGKVTMKVHGLEPESQYEFRIFSLDKEGKMSKPASSFIVQTLERWRLPAWFWRILIASVLGLGAYVLIRVRRGDFELEA